MITFESYDDTIKKVYTHGQQHVFTFWDELTDGEKRELLQDLSGIDFGKLKQLYEIADKDGTINRKFGPPDYIPLPMSKEDKKLQSEAREAGTGHICAGKTAAFVVAGGQGTRLGFDGPKGIFPVGPVSNKSLFQIHAEKILKSCWKYGVAIPWLIMTSRGNHEDTVDFFNRHKNFGLDANNVTIFPQNMIPSIDLEGRLILESRSRVFRNPDGHGGSLTALESSGALKAMELKGIETISYFQVDNPLVRIIDPVFIGFHVIRNADVSSKGLLKAYPEEKLGVFVRFDDGSTGVVEYSDLPEKLQNRKEPDGRLTFRMGSIAIHLFRLKFIKTITGETTAALPFHVARKKIPSLSSDGIRELEGYKFEKFVFDALPLTGNNVVLETVREEEFAPVKNRNGIDSVDSCRELMSSLHHRWLKERSITVPETVKVVEISPLLAVEADDLDKDQQVPSAEKVYLE